MSADKDKTPENMPGTTSPDTVDNTQAGAQSITDRKVDQYYGELPQDNTDDLDDLDDSLSINENRNEALEIPFEYESIVEQITESVFNGYVCFLNPETLEIEQVADEGTLGMSDSEYAEQNDDMIDEFGLNYTQWDNYIRFEPFSRDDMMNRIDDFITSLNDQKLQSQLEDFPDEAELFNLFPAILERTGKTLDWNVFLRNEIEAYVKSQLSDTIRRHTDSNNEIYDV
ncbi:hypothetical protein [Prevotella sp. 10(H)]|uniref:hypothetical protein n=1 Tax=Prevotella sp. 10(H) TaxID=1158294 RepID=UPI0004A6FEFB|nr:hypothetical protein [Prevotella sp. 10(H)]